MDFGTRRVSRPGVEVVEARELPSGLIAAMAAEAPPVPSAVVQVDRRAVAASAAQQPELRALAAQSGSGSGHGGTQAGYTFTGNTSSTLLGSGTPTPQELAREVYHSTFVGRDYVGPGRFSDQGTTYFYRGLGSSNFFLHGDFNMAVVTPTDPAVPFIGEAVLNDKNINSGGIQGFILTGSRADIDAQGRPTRLTFQGDPNIYSGVFNVEAAEGTTSITYGPKNSVRVTFQGKVYTTGLTSPLVNQDLYARHGRPLRFHGNINTPTRHGTG